MKLRSPGVLTALASTVTIFGCATASKDIVTAHVSPIQYQTYSCDQIAGESQRISTRVTQLSGRLDQAAANDQALAGVGAILFWPALFALGGTKEQEAEYARLKGESEALQQSAIIKSCGKAPSVLSGTSSIPAPVDKTDPTVLANSGAANKEAELRALKKLYDDGLVTKEVYIDRQSRVLAN